MKCALLPQQKAARVQRRYRRSFDSSGNRVVEGLEIVKTFRVLDGVAGLEMPTSTTKSQLRLIRPKEAEDAEEEGEGEGDGV